MLELPLRACFKFSSNSSVHSLWSSRSILAASCRYHVTTICAIDGTKVLLSGKLVLRLVHKAGHSASAWTLYPRTFVRSSRASWRALSLAFQVSRMPIRIFKGLTRSPYQLPSWVGEPQNYLQCRRHDGGQPRSE